MILHNCVVLTVIELIPQLAEPVVRTIRSLKLSLQMYRRLGAKTERSGDPHRESKPSAHHHRAARIAGTTRQINGAVDFCG